MSFSVLLDTIKSRTPLRLDSVPCYVPDTLHRSILLTKVVNQYVRKGAVQHLPKETGSSTKYWVPVFGEPRKDKSLRLINNFRGLNQCFSNNKFKMDNWTTLRNALRNRALDAASPWTSSPGSTTWQAIRPAGGG